MIFFAVLKSRELVLADCCHCFLLHVPDLSDVIQLPIDVLCDIEGSASEKGKSRFLHTLSYVIHGYSIFRQAEKEKALDLWCKYSRLYSQCLACFVVVSQRRLQSLKTARDNAFMPTNTFSFVAKKVSYNSNQKKWKKIKKITGIILNPKIITPN